VDIRDAIAKASEAALIAMQAALRARNGERSKYYRYLLRPGQVTIHIPPFWYGGNKKKYADTSFPSECLPEIREILASLTRDAVRDVLVKQ
jgi:hypothetical protein